MISRPISVRYPDSSSLADIQSLSMMDRPRSTTVPFLTFPRTGARDSITDLSVEPTEFGIGVDDVGHSRNTLGHSNPPSSIAFRMSSPISPAPGELRTATNPGLL